LQSGMGGPLQCEQGRPSRWHGFGLHDYELYDFVLSTASVGYRSPRRYASTEEEYQVTGGASSSRQELPASRGGAKSRRPSGAALRAAVQQSAIPTGFRSLPASDLPLPAVTPGGLKEMDGTSVIVDHRGSVKELGYTFAADAHGSILRAASARCRTTFRCGSSPLCSILGGPDELGGRRFGAWGGLSGESAEEVTLAWSVAHLACVVPVQAATRSRITRVGRPSFR
jgi:hypothetical protein